MSKKYLKPIKEERNRKSLPDFLIDSGFRPFLIVGKLMKFFGTWIVVSLLLGMISMYIYSRIDTAPYHDTLFPKVKKEEMLIEGKVQDWEGRPLEKGIAYIAPAEYKQDIRDGRVELTVPKGSYRVIIADKRDPREHGIDDVWEGDRTFDIKMPPEVGRIKGRIVDMDKKPKGGKIVCISGGPLKSEVCARTDSDGVYTLESIPGFSLGAGHLSIKVESSDIEKTIEKVNVHMTNEVPDIVVAGDRDPVVYGVVRDRNGRPVANIWVEIDGKYSESTSHDGHFSISVPSRGDHHIEVWWREKLVYSAKIHISKDRIRHDIRLR